MSFEQFQRPVIRNGGDDYGPGHPLYRRSFEPKKSLAVFDKFRCVAGAADVPRLIYEIS